MKKATHTGIFVTVNPPPPNHPHPFRSGCACPSLLAPSGHDCSRGCWFSQQPGVTLCVAWRRLSGIVQESVILRIWRDFVCGSRRGQNDESSAGLSVFGFFALRLWLFHFASVLQTAFYMSVGVISYAGFGNAAPGNLVPSSWTPPPQQAKQAKLPRCQCHEPHTALFVHTSPPMLPARPVYSPETGLRAGERERGGGYLKSPATVQPLRAVQPDAVCAAGPHWVNGI